MGLIFSNPLSPISSNLQANQKRKNHHHEGHLLGERNKITSFDARCAPLYEYVVNLVRVAVAIIPVMY